MSKANEAVEFIDWWRKTKPLSKKQILNKIKETNEGENTKVGFCQNSRRWIMLMWERPETCALPDAEVCDENCGYYVLREPTHHLIQKLREYRWGTSGG